MRIANIKITGFKSFVDGVSLPISSGLTGIVGPNGCGKSNILEAMRWVMGATSAKALRGSEMDDVIFSGTDTRPARDIAEVVLTLENNDKSAPEPFRNDETLEISRRIRRGIGSVFRINGKEVRAKDVQLIFADASSGANSPALVRQGQVSELINAKPENRRRVIEEAAGISGIQARRHEAQTKLAATQTNLERIGEIIIIMEEQVNALKKEARRAEKYRGLASNIRAFETFIQLQRFESMKASFEKTIADFNAANSQSGEAIIKVNAANRAIEEIEKKIPAAREEQAIADAILRQLEAKKHDFDRDLQLAQELATLSNSNIARIDQDSLRENELLSDAEEAISENDKKLAELGEIINLDAEIENAQIKADEAHQKTQNLEAELNIALSARAKLEAEWQNANSAKAQSESEIARLEAQLKSQASNLQQKSENGTLLIEIEKLAEQIKSKENELETANKAYETLQIEVQNCQIIENECRQQKDEISNKYNKLKAQADGLSSIIGKGGKSINRPALDEIKVAAGYERAVAAALGDDLDGAIANDGDIVWRGANAQEIAWPDTINQNLKTLKDVVSAPKELNARLVAVAIIDDETFAKIDALPIGLRIVTLNGDLKRWDGFTKSRNAQSSSAIRLEQKNQLTDLLTQIEPLEDAQKEAAANLASARANLMSAQTRANNGRNAAPEIMRALGQLRSQFSRLEGEKMRKDGEIAALIANIENSKAALLDAQNRLKELERAQTRDFKVAINEANDAASNLSKKVQDARAEASKALSNYMSLSREQESREANIKELKAQNDTWLSRIERAQTRLAELAQERIKQISALEIANSKPKEIEVARQALLNELPIIEARKAKADDIYSQIEIELRTANTELRQCESALAIAKEAQNSAAILRDSWVERIDEFKLEIQTNFNFAADELERRAEAALGNSFASMTLEKAQSNLARALSDRETLGGVNLRAEDELKEQSERADKLRTESEDLLAAIGKLNKAIDEINAEGRERLLAAFDVVNGHFSQLFGALFGGGEAHLALTETDDPLGGGLEVYACPPGKRLQTMSLMSGGEQALTATALIFAVFLSNPAPVSVLDELDAPLDDANVDRFCALMDEMRKRTETRFICITHHPITMARMDRLFGVTMAERGVSQIVAVDLSRAEAMIN